MNQGPSNFTDVEHEYTEREAQDFERTGRGSPWRQLVFSIAVFVTQESDEEGGKYAARHVFYRRNGAMP